MDRIQQRVEEYREHQALHRKVDGLTKTLEGIVERNPTEDSGGLRLRLVPRPPGR